MLAMLILAAVVWAQETVPQDAESEPEPIPVPARNANAGGVERQNGGLVLNFRDAAIDMVLDELSQAAGLIIVKEVQPQGRVTLVSRQPLSQEDAVALLNTVLHSNGYGAVQQGRILKIVPRDQAKRLSIPVHSGSDPSRIDPTDELITQVIPLRHASATELREDLQALINPEADFTANASSNALVITDTAANVRRVVQIINALDTSLAGAVEVRVFQLQYANASSAARLINDVFGELEVGAAEEQPADTPGARFRQFVQQQQQQQQQQRGQRGQRGQQQAAPRTPRIAAAADDRTNSVVVTGPADTLSVVGDILDELDANPVADETVFVYRLRNAQALNLEAVVNSLFGNWTAAGVRGTPTNTQWQGQRGGGQQNQRGVQQNQRGGAGRTIGGGGARTTPGGGASGGGLGGGGRLGGGAFGQAQTGQAQQQLRGGPGGISPAAMQTAAELAGQVTIIADPDTNSLLVRTSPANFDRVRVVLDELDRPVAQVLIKVLIAEVTHDNALDVGMQFSILNIRAGGLGQRVDTNFNIPTEGPAATGLVVQVLEQDFQSAIRALETAGKLDVLSRPYILASDNQLASIMVGQEVPFPTSSRITDTGQTITQFLYGDVGILLDVIPHINPDGLVILDVAPEISALTGITVPMGPGLDVPVIAKRSAYSRVGVRNGETVVIGGLMEDRRTQMVNKVPILGDLPLIGRAFRRTQSTKVKTELLIFLTPHVAFNPEALEEMGQEELDGTQLVPRAVEPGMFEEHRQGLHRGQTPEWDLPQRDPPDEDLPEPAERPQEPWQ